MPTPLRLRRERDLAVFVGEGLKPGCIHRERKRAVADAQRGECVKVGDDGCVSGEPRLPIDRRAECRAAWDANDARRYRDCSELLRRRVEEIASVHGSLLRTRDQRFRRRTIGDQHVHDSRPERSGNRLDLVCAAGDGDDARRLF